MKSQQDQTVCPVTHTWQVGESGLKPKPLRLGTLTSSFLPYITSIHFQYCVGSLAKSQGLAQNWHFSLPKKAVLRTDSHTYLLEENLMKMK